MQLRITLACALAARAAAADPAGPPLVTVEVADSELDISEMLQPLAWSHDDPVGVIVPPGPCLWNKVGLVAGDIILRDNGKPVDGPPLLGEGQELLDIVRDGRPLLVRVIIHGDATQEVEVSDAAVRELVHGQDKLAVPVVRAGATVGVRVTGAQWSFHLRSGDVIRAIDHTPISNEAGLIALVDGMPVGKNTIELEREGTAIELDVTRDAPIDLHRIHRIDATHFAIPKDVFEGISDDTDLITSRASFAAGKDGVAAIAIAPDSLLALAGLQDGDELLDVAGIKLVWNDGSMSGVMIAATMAIRVGGADGFVVHVRRHGRPIALSYRIS
ncbi:MAG TPA: hypothetical protein VLX92_22355 [Kofleriaceae bacterium]|nr:hypothetical protein [Kofleriaceae bacterium]